MYITGAYVHTGSGIAVGLLGVIYYAEIHHIAYFIVIQILVGMFEVGEIFNTHIYIYFFHKYT